jgi:intracellular sulfur oxidation DsrE/DsrF family protein
MKHLVACLLLLPLSALSQEKVNPAIKNFGSVYAIPDATEKPDPKMTYKILVDITDAAAKPDTLNIYLEAVATLYNLHVVGGVPPSHIKMVVVLHKMATLSVLDDEKYQQRFHCNNPNLGLLRSLADAGVRFFVCGQTLTRAKIAASDISPDVAVATSALTTLTTYQLKGYALINFK